MIRIGINTLISFTLQGLHYGIKYLDKEVYTYVYYFMYTTDITLLQGILLRT